MHAKTQRKRHALDTAPFIVISGIVIRFVCVEPDTLTQFVSRPTARLFVCDCNCQPVWSTGQLS